MKTLRGFGGVPLKRSETIASNLDLTSARAGLFAWLPYIVIIIVVVAWTGPQSHLPSISLFSLAVSAKSSVTQVIP